jgi:hypothetical protein
MRTYVTESYSVPMALFCRNYLKGLKKIKDKHQSGQPMYRLGFKADTSQTPVLRVTATPTWSIKIVTFPTKQET